MSTTTVPPEMLTTNSPKFCQPIVQNKFLARQIYVIKNILRKSMFYLFAVARLFQNAKFLNWKYITITRGHLYCNFIANIMSKITHNQVFYWV